MSQKNITSFFKPVEKGKTVLKRIDNSSPIKSKSKKFKTVSPEKENLNESCIKESSECSSLLPEAGIILQCKKTPGLFKNVGTSWFEALKPEFQKTYFEKLSSFLTTERSNNTIYPPEKDVYSWTNYCSIDDIKVVILGQDPYHGTGQAHGLCFSVQKGIAIPPSLRNMYKELESDIEGFKNPGHGYLAGWSEQGVLLLNAVLTVRANNANSHKDKGWEKFTDSVMKTVSEKNEGVVFLLWGSYAQKKAAVVDKKKHHLLNAPHPSPLSAHRGFLGCKHFSKCNELLEKAGKKQIDWNCLPIEK